MSLRAIPRSSGSRSCSVTAPRETSQMWRVPRGRELVDAVVAAVDERRGAPGLEHAHDERHALEARHPDGRGLRSGRVAQRPEDVEQGRDAELLARRPRVPESRVELRRERERDAGLAEHLGDALRFDVEIEAERREHIRRAGGRTRAAIAVLDHRDAGRRGDDRRDRGDVQHGAVGVASGADDVEHHGVDGQRRGVREHRIPEADDLVDGLPLHAQSDQQTGQLRRRRLTFHHAAHRPVRLRDRQVVTVGEGAEDARPRVFPLLR